MASMDLAAAVASRICHDLVSPVGAMVNGVDLLRELGPADAADAVGMIGQSAARASALLQFYRLAFGAAATDAQPVGRAALRELALVLAQPPRIVLQWQADGAPLERDEARLVALLLLCARSVTGMRAVIAVQPGPRCVLPLVITVEAEAFASSVELLDLLESEPRAPISPRAVEFVMARELALKAGVPLRAVRTGKRMTIQAGSASGGV